jgi:hypothetical protein
MYDSPVLLSEALDPIRAGVIYRAGRMLYFEETICVIALGPL